MTSSTNSLWEGIPNWVHVGVKHSSIAMKLGAGNFYPVDNTQHKPGCNLMSCNQWNKYENGWYVWVHIKYSMN